MPNAYTRTAIVRLSEVERAELASMARSRSLPAALALRARIVLACEGDDKASTEVAQALGINRTTVAKWRARYVRHRISGLYDELRPGRPRTVDDERVAELIAKTLHTKPADGGTHWSTRTLAGETGISKSTVARCSALPRAPSTTRSAPRLSRSRPTSTAESAGLTAETWRRTSSRAASVHTTQGKQRTPW
jgi:putative transposase